MQRPTVEDLTGDSSIAQLARRHWLTKAPTKALPETVAALWDDAVDGEDSAFSLLLLEQLQALERFLWPGYSDESSNQHVLLIALLVNVKRQEQLPIWNIFSNRSDEFASLFRRIEHLSIDQSLSVKLRTHLLSFLVTAFQSLENGLVRKECAALVSIGIWHNLHSESARSQHLAKSIQLQKAWRAAGKKYDNADGAGQARLRFERSWLYTLLLDFLDRLYDSEASPDQKQDNIVYCERFLELLCDLQSQLPTRRYVNTLVQDLNTLPAMQLSPLVQEGNENGLLKDMGQLLYHYTYFPIDDQTGKQLSKKESDDAHNSKLARLQNVALKLQSEKLKILVLSNYGSLDKREELLNHLQPLTDAELLEVCEHLGLRTAYPEKSLVVQDRVFMDEILVSSIERRTPYTESIRRLAILPTEKLIYDLSLMRTESYDGTRPLPIPKLNLQYLTLGDFLWRSFILCRCEAFFEIRSHLEDTIKRLQPRRQGAIMRFDGFSKMAIPINKPAIIEALPPRVGEEHPAEVKVEVILDVSKLQPGLRREWEALRQNDVVYLIALNSADSPMKPMNGHDQRSAAEEIGLKALRCAEVISVLDDNGRVLKRDHDHGDDSSRPRQRRLLLRLDAESYVADKASADSSKGDIYESINVIVRRTARENNFKPVLESLRQLALSEVPIPSWLQEVFLGYGNPASATYKNLPNRLKSIDYRDTFLDWQHLVESLPGKAIEPDPSMDSSFPPPYVLESNNAETVPPAPRPSKKRRRDQPEAPAQPPTSENFQVSTYKQPNHGPYPENVVKSNTVRFTPAQIEAITSGTQPGLTVIVGPPGTGKTDVATQIINNIYHNFPQQRTLLVAHSNQALNQLFQKIVALDIDERHLLRLGHGEEELKTQTSFSKAGRVDSFLERGGYYLTEVNRLAASIGAPGAHGSSCETAEYFNQVYIQPRWKRYWEELSSGADVVDAFPFASYFANAPQPLFAPSLSREALIEIAAGCEHHMRNIFSELADIRPFEILRSQRDKSNYLLVKEARIIAMTSTHAAMRRKEIAGLGFEYDNVIMEEAAQVTEAESFIPFAMQSHKSGTSIQGDLQRIILVGDHLQNSPVVQNAAFRTYANLEQSLFRRLIRLGVPHTTLDAQGRSRPSISSLCSWRYPTLSNLPTTSTQPEFIHANAGFRFDYQFIDVPDYKGKGETAPSPHFIQNLGEAEYAVALYQYMRLLGYPAERISILTTYAGQRALIRDVLTHRCKANRLFGMPGWVGTVDKYQGEQNDYVILSLVRTKTPGYLRDLRRVTVALSRARLGLYILGRREVFESSLELRDAFNLPFARNNKLELVTGEVFPTERLVDADKPEGAVEMEGVEHLGKYVFQMTQAKIAALKAGSETLPPPAQADRSRDEEDEEEDAEDAEPLAANEELAED